MFKSSTYPFDKTLEKATSLTNLEPDWESIMQLCDAIRQNDVQPKYALSAIRKKLFSTNPNVQLMGLKVLESCVKNCGPALHCEIATKEFMEETIHAMLNNAYDVKVKNEILRLVQAWSHAFRNEPSYKAVSKQMQAMKAEGHQFPTLKESDAMFSTDVAPEWTDGECCHRCRTQFGVMNRKHHCRHCGQIFCAKCSSKTSTIPKFGIEKEVRVCDLCYDKINKKIEIKKVPINDLNDGKKVGKGSTTSSSVANQSTTPTKTKTEQEIQEEEELQLALALSKSEAESLEQERMKQFRKSNYSTGTSSSAGNATDNHSNKSHKKSSSMKSSSRLKSSKKSSSRSSSTSPTRSKADPEIENDDPELARYLNREYWEQRSQSFGDYEPSPSPSAPQPSLTAAAATTTGNLSSSMNSTKNDNELKSMSSMINNKYNLQNDPELDTFLKNLESTIEIFVNRLQSNKLRGRPITNDSGVQALFMNLTNMHSHLMMYMQQTSEARTNCERLQDKIQQIRDARAALDALRDEHREQLKRAAAEAERLRQQQMAQKLDIMRKQKQQYLQYQRELAIQRMQEQERELMMRTELLKFGQQPPQQQQPPIQWNPAMAIGQQYHPMPPYYPSHPENSPMNYAHGMAAPPAQMLNQVPGTVQYPQTSMSDHSVVGGGTNPILGAVPPQPTSQQPYYMPQSSAPYMATAQPQPIGPTTGAYVPSYGVVTGMQSQTSQTPSQQPHEQPPPPPQQPAEPVKEPVKEELLISFD